MGHKCFVSFKKEDIYYKEKLVTLFSKEDIIAQQRYMEDGLNV